MKKRLIIISIAFVVSFISMVVLSLFSMERFTTYAEYSDLTDETNAVIRTIMRLELNLRNIDRAERGYVITHDTMYVRFLNNSIDSIYSLLGDLTIEDREKRGMHKNIALFKSSFALRVAAARTNLAYVDTAANSSVPSKFYFDSRQLMLECSAKLRSMDSTENAVLREQFAKEGVYHRLTTNTLKSLLFVFCIVTLILFVVMIKELRGRMSYQLELQAKVIDLRRSHSELQEIAYAASHDLQEPLRKIQVFSNKLLYQKADKMDEECKETLDRINGSANRMQSLITDLVSLTNLANIDESKTLIDLNRLLKYIVIDVEERVAEKQAVIDIQALPMINGYENQVRILFKALLDNALKFTRPGVKPVINISCETITGHELAGINPNLLEKKFYRVTCSDNGIGFDNRFMSKIFQIFQRLHTEESEYEGKGIGLAICQRIMANHEGYILGHGEPGMGAKFKLFFPAE